MSKYRVSITKVTREAAQVLIEATSPDIAEVIGEQMARQGQVEWQAGKVEFVSVAPPLPEQE